MFFTNRPSLYLNSVFGSFLAQPCHHYPRQDLTPSHKMGILSYTSCWGPAHTSWQPEISLGSEQRCSLSITGEEMMGRGGLGACPQQGCCLILPLWSSWCPLALRKPEWHPKEAASTERLRWESRCCWAEHQEGELATQSPQIRALLFFSHNLWLPFQGSINQETPALICFSIIFFGCCGYLLEGHSSPWEARCQCWFVAGTARNTYTLRCPCCGWRM